MPKNATFPNAAYPVIPPMLFHAVASTMNIAMIVAIRNHSLSARRGTLADWAASSEVSGASRADAAEPGAVRGGPPDYRRRPISHWGRGTSTTTMRPNAIALAKTDPEPGSD